MISLFFFLAVWLFGLVFHLILILISTNLGFENIALFLRVESHVFCHILRCGAFCPLLFSFMSQSREASAICLTFRCRHLSVHNSLKCD